MPDRQITVDSTSSALVLTEAARKTWAQMAHHVAALRSAYGKDHKYTTEAADSFVHVASSLVGWGNVNVGRDGDLSLICNEVRPDGSFGIVFGLIFHGTRRACLNTGCKAVVNDDGKAWTYSPGAFMCDQHDLTYPLGAPTPGTWTFHS